MPSFTHKITTRSMLIITAAILLCDYLHHSSNAFLLYDNHINNKLLSSFLLQSSIPSLSSRITRRRGNCIAGGYDNQQNSNVILFMGKGDGKKKRKKKSASNDVTSAAASAPLQQPLPQRVTNDINIPIKRQIKWARIKKEAAKQSGQSFRKAKVVRTAYRRTWDEEEIEQKREERARRGKDPDWAVILNQTVAKPLVIVDGYNIIYKWSRLKKHMVKGDTQRARQLLIDDLELLRTLHRWRIEVVFDGAGKSNVGPLGHGPGGGVGGTEIFRIDNEVKKDISKNGVRIVFTGNGIEADSYIEKRCFEAKNVTNGVLTRSFIVATDDGMIKLAGQNAGAFCMSASRFVDELKAAKKGIQYQAAAALEGSTFSRRETSSQQGGGGAGYFTYGDDVEFTNRPLRNIKINNGESQRARRKRLEEEERRREQ